MLLALLQFDLLIHDAQSLKDKRRVVSSLKARLHQDHLAAVAEVGHQDTLNLARMALVLIGNDAQHLAQNLDRITTKVRELAAPAAELGGTHRQILHADQLLSLDDAPTPRDTPLPPDLTQELISRGLSALDSTTP